MRVDLPHLADAADGPLLARTLVAHLGRDGARRGVLVLYTDRDPAVEDGCRAARPPRHFREAAADALGDVLVWVVTPTGYLSLDCADATAARRAAGRCATSTRRRSGATLVLAGLRRRGLAGGHRPDPSASARGPPLRRARPRAGGSDRCAGPLAAGADGAEPVAGGVARGLADGGRRRARPANRHPAARRGGASRRGLADRRVRDGVLVALVPGTADLPERCVRTVPSTPELDRGARRRDGADPRPAAAASCLRSRATAVHEAVLEEVVARGQEPGRRRPR